MRTPPKPRPCPNHRVHIEPLSPARVARPVLRSPVQISPLLDKKQQHPAGESLILLWESRLRALPKRALLASLSSGRKYASSSRRRGLPVCRASCGSRSARCTAFTRWRSSPLVRAGSGRASHPRPPAVDRRTADAAQERRVPAFCRKPAAVDTQNPGLFLWMDAAGRLNLPASKARPVQLPGRCHPGVQAGCRNRRTGQSTRPVPYLLRHAPLWLPPHVWLFARGRVARLPRHPLPPPSTPIRGSRPLRPPQQPNIGPAAFRRPPRFSKSWTICLAPDRRLF